MLRHYGKHWLLWIIVKNKIHIDWRGRPVVVDSRNEQFASMDGQRKGHFEMSIMGMTCSQRKGKINRTIEK